MVANATQLGRAGNSGGAGIAGPHIQQLEKILLLGWVIVNLVLGILTVHEYGISIDETNNQRYAAHTLEAYASFFGTRFEPYYDSSYDGHGPAFVTIAAIFVRLIQAIFPTAVAADLWHYAYFITFVLAGLCLYWLARRWFSAWTSWALLLLFGTQPLLLGHAFINPKDIPFMFLLSLSVAMGLRMVDRIAGEGPLVSLEAPLATLAIQFRAADVQRRRRFLRYLVIAAVVGLALVIFSSPLLIERLITFFYTAAPDTGAGRIFGAVASSTARMPLEDYVAKAVKLYNRILLLLLFAGALFFLAYLGLLINNTTLLAFLRRLGSQRGAPGRDGTGGGASFRLWIRDLLRALRNPDVVLAGVALGLATGVRAIAPIAGLVVFLSLFARVRSRAWATAIAYFLVAGIVTYLSWPRLWDAPVQRYLEGLGVISDFTHFPGQVLFNGQIHGATDLPRLYLPTLLSIQFTEPAILGIYLGLGILIWRLLRDRLPLDLLLYTGLTFALPLLGLIVLRSTLYNNFRQALFIVPALFLLAAFPLEFLFRKVTGRWARVLLIVALALPGIYSTARLYPYEYVYYNSLVGGPAGAQNRFELDYWRISLREMALKMNEVAPPGSIIVVNRSAGLFARYARPDLVIDKPVNSILDLTKGYDYLVQLKRWDRWEEYPEATNVVVVERLGAVLATAKDVRDLTRK
jgi:4-amino-4-deoxy-L-arabinose transferase-like glycosyltransferase